MSSQQLGIDNLSMVWSLLRLTTHPLRCNVVLHVSPLTLPSGISYSSPLSPRGTVMRMILPRRVSRSEAKLFGSKGGPPSPTAQYRSSLSFCGIICQADRERERGGWREGERNEEDEAAVVLIESKCYRSDISRHITGSR